MNNNFFQTKFEFNNLSELIDIYLETNYRYKNESTKLNTEISLRFLKNKKYVDLDEINNFIINNKKWNESTKKTKIGNVITFLKWLSNLKNIYIDVKKLQKFNQLPSKKEEYSIQELKIIRNTILKVMKNKTLYFYFEMLLWNGCRLGELVNIDWAKIKKENYNLIIMALKNGNERSIEVPNHLIEFLDNPLNLKTKYQTVKNWFQKLQKLIKTMHSDWYKPVSSHCGRVHRATYAMMNGMSATEISVMYGAKNFHTFHRTYIRGKALNKSLINRANQDPISAMNDFEKDQEISKLRKLVELQKIHIENNKNQN